MPPPVVPEDPATVESVALEIITAPTIIAITVTTIVHTEMPKLALRFATQEEQGQSVSEESQRYWRAFR